MHNFLLNVFHRWRVSSKFINKSEKKKYANFFNLIYMSQNDPDFSDTLSSNNQNF